MASLRAAGYRTCLVAPGPGGRALLGPGASEVSSWIDSSGRDLSPLWAPDADPPALLREELGADVLSYAVSADPDLAANLGRWTGRLLVQRPAPPPGVHASEWHAQPLGSLGLEVVGDVPLLQFVADEREGARRWTERLPDRFLALHPGSGSPRKSWPAHRYAELAAVLARGEPFLAICGPADAAAAEPLLRLPNAVPASGLPLRVLGAVLAEAGVFVGNDSGITHLAGASGAPTLALFGPTDPAQWAPVGPAVRVLRAEPLDGLSVQEVEGAAATLWAREPRSR